MPDFEIGDSGGELGERVGLSIAGNARRPGSPRLSRPDRRDRIPLVQRGLHGGDAVPAGRNLRGEESC